MARSPIVVTALCALAFAGAVAGVLAFAAGAEHSGRAPLVESTRALLDVLESSRLDERRPNRIEADAIQSHLAPGYSLRDERVYDVLAEAAAASRKGALIITSARVTDGGERGETDVVVASSVRFSRRTTQTKRTLSWVRDARGNWGLVPIWQ